MKALINAGADINHFKDGRTCLAGAVLNNDFNSVRNLVELGADLNVSQRYSPLAIAQLKEYQKVSEYLTEKGAESRSTCFQIS